MSLSDPQLEGLLRDKKIILFSKPDERLARFLKYLAGKNLIYQSYNFANDAGNKVQMYMDDTGVVHIDGQFNILQSAYSNDFDVIDIDKNTSFVDYNNLSKTFYTKIGGTSNETPFKNNKCVDKDNNLYIIAQYSSSYINIFDSTNNSVPVIDLQKGDGDTEVFIVKYNHLGEYVWSTHIGGIGNKFYPSLVTDSNGNLFVCVRNNNFGDVNNVPKIYDTTNNNSPVATMMNCGNSTTILIKYNSSGVYQWSTHINGASAANNYLINPRVACDKSGNVIVSQAVNDITLYIYDTYFDNQFNTPNEEEYVRVFYSASAYNYVSVKYDSTGRFKWLNHIEMAGETDFTPQCFVDCDSEDNMIIAGNFNSTIKIFDPANLSIPNPVNPPSAIINPLPNEYTDDNLFIIKFNDKGRYVWGTKISIQDEDTRRCNLIVDLNNNIYVSCELEYDSPTYLFDTTSQTSPKFTIPNKLGYRSIIVVKYNTNGIIQWYNYIETKSTGEGGNVYTPCLALDNRNINGIDDTHLYLSSYYYEAVNFFNANNYSNVAYSLKYSSVYGNSNTFIASFDKNGKLSWATRAASNNSVSDNSISADKDGHVYLMGTYETLLYMYDAQNNDTPIATMTKASGSEGDSDIFIIKYNRFGLLNIQSPRLLYLEDSAAIPDSFCKQIIITNNNNSGIVHLNILKKENYGYSVRRTVVISEGIELITNGGIWIPKIISDQYEYVNDLDVIDTNTKTSFVNYNELQNTFYTRIGGPGSDVNPQLGLDKDGNLYVAGCYDSSELSFYDATNNTVPVANLYKEGSKNLFITKYSHSGSNLWRTKISGWYEESEPSIYTSKNGDSFVAFQSSDSIEDSIYIFDVNNSSSPVKTLSGYDNKNTVACKYNAKGEFLWNVRVKATDSGAFTSTGVVTGDMDGNMYLVGYCSGNTFEIYDSGSDSTPAQIFTTESITANEYFIVKFDYTGKLLYVNHIEGGLSGSSGSPDEYKVYKIAIQTDISGNLYLTSSFYSTVNISNAGTDTVIATITNSTNDNGIFTIKYDKNGTYKWNNKILCTSNSSGAIQSSSVIDADGNLYIAFYNNFVSQYRVYDTLPNTPQPVYIYSIGEQDFVSMVKFNTNGIYQWNNIIKAQENPSFYRTKNPVITCDNRYVNGQYKSNIYVQINTGVYPSRSGFNFYNANALNNVAYTLQAKDGNTFENDFYYSILAKYNLNGEFQWSTGCAASLSEGDTVFSSSIVADKDGHVYMGGSFYYTLYMFDVSTNGTYDNFKASMSSNGSTDCYLVKYNRFGLIDTNVHPSIYIEDREEVPNAFEKSIVITYNSNNGPVNCNILERITSGFGFNVRRTITLTDALDLVCNGGKWIPKVQAEQISLSNDLDVIDINTKLSVIDKNNLGEASWYTTVSGSGNEQNARVSTDRDNNVYMVGTYTSPDVTLNDLQNSGGKNVIRNNTKDILVGKYLSSGEAAWVTHIALQNNNSVGLNTPTIYTDMYGNSYVSIVKNYTGTTDSCYIFDTRDNNTVLQTVQLENNSTIVVKYDKDGIYQWHVKLSAYYSVTQGTSDSNCVVDEDGNMYVNGYVKDFTGLQIYDTSNLITGEVINLSYVNNPVGMFVVKFDKIGKYQWNTIIKTDSIPDYKSSISCDNDGNVIVSGIQLGSVDVYHRINEVQQLYGSITFGDTEYGLYMVKYDNTGKCIWTNKLNSAYTSARGVSVGIGASNIYYTTDTNNWLPVSGVFTNGGQGVVWNGKIWVALGEGTNSIAYSYNGISWVGLGTSTFGIGYKVAWNGKMFVACGQGTNTLAYSDDGISWTGAPLSTSLFTAAFDVHWNGSMWIAVGEGGNTMAYSMDGINWTGLGAPVFSTRGNGIYYDTTKWVACGEGTNTLAYSTDGLTWIGLGTGIFSVRGYKAVWNGEKWLAGGEGGNTLAYSTNGTVWNPVPGNNTIFSSRCRSVSWTDNRWVAVGDGTRTINYSYDGIINWTGFVLFTTYGAAIDWTGATISNPVTTIDGSGNYYLATSISGTQANIYDTRNSTDVRHTPSIPSPSIPENNRNNIMLIKYNSNGIVQWYTFVSGYSTLASLCVDNRFVKGISRNNVYLSGAYNGNNAGILYLYSATTSGDVTDLDGVLTRTNYDAFVVRYDNNGQLDWYTKVGGANSDINNSIVATQDGHVYLAGEFSTSTVSLYQGYTLGTDPISYLAATITNSNSGNYDLFLVKLNRYGTVNNGSYRFGRELYLENSSDIPDGTEKSIVIANNVETNNNITPTNICLMIIDKYYPGYSVYRTLWFCEGVTMISYGGKWIMKSSSTGDSLPKRTIVMWGGQPGEIPAGWRLCDGGNLNGVITPDLRGRFVLGYNDGAAEVNGYTTGSGGKTAINTLARTGTDLSGAVGRTGGEIQHSNTIGEIPAHRHGNTISDPGHYHVCNANDAGSNSGSFGQSTGSDISFPGSYQGNLNTNNAFTNVTINNAYTGGHNSAVNGSTNYDPAFTPNPAGNGLTESHNNIPPYYVLAFIMKCY